MKSRIVSIFLSLVMVASIFAAFTQNLGPLSMNASAPGGLANSPWPMFRNNLRHTGLSPYDTSANNGELKWSFTTNDKVCHTSAAIGSDETIYVGSDDSKLYAINPDGTEKWNFTTGNNIYSSPAIGSDGTIYIGSDDSNFYAIDPDGTEKWRFTVGIGGIWYSSPVIGPDNIIYIGNDDNKLYAINPDGSEKWNFTTGDNVRSSPAIGSDGTIYFGSMDNQLYAINPDGSQKWSFTTSECVHSSPAIGSDGTIYVGSRDDKLYAINPDGSQKWSFTTGGSVDSSPAIGSDGTIYIGSMDNIFYAINPDGTQKWTFTTGNEVNSSPAIDSDGTIYIGSYDYKLYALNPDGTEKWNFTTGWLVRSSPAIGSDGTIYVGSYDGKLYAIGPNTAPNITVEKTANVTVTKPGNLIEYTIYYNNTVEFNITNDFYITHQQLTFEEALQFDPNFSPDGNKVVYRSEEAGGGYFDIWKMDANGVNHQQLTFENADQSQPCYNPNGSKIAYESWESGSTYSDIWIMDADGSNHQQLTSEHVLQRSPTFSPDGNKIAYTSKEDGGSYWDIWIMDTDGSNRQQLTSENVDQYWPCFSPDGNRILYSSYEDGGGYIDIWIMDANGLNHNQLTFKNYNQNRPSFNPDGTKIIYDSLEDGGSYNDLWIMDHDGSEHKQLTFEDKTQIEAQFNPNGNQIAYTSKEDGGIYYDIWALNLTTQNGTAKTVWINDSLPSGVIFVNSSAETNRTGDYNWTFYDVRPGGHNFTIIVQVNDNVPNGTILTNYVHLDYTDSRGNPMPESSDSVDVTVLIEPPPLPPTLYINVSLDGEDVILYWDPPSTPGIDHYLIYRSTSQIGFDFNTVWVNTSSDNESGELDPIPLRTMWNDTKAALPGDPGYEEEYYYIIRAVNVVGEASRTSRTVGKWTKTFPQGVSTLSIPLEPLGNFDTEWYTSNMNAEYIKYMNTTTHTWMQHNFGDGSSNNTQMKLGEGYEVKFNSETNYTFTGLPGAMIRYKTGGFTGFDHNTDAKNLSATVDAITGNVTLNWTPPSSMDGDDSYKVYRSTTRDGFDNGTAVLLDTLPYGNETYVDPGAALLFDQCYYMVIPVNETDVEGSSTYSIGIWTEEILSQYDTIGIPLKMSSTFTIDWYCDNIPDTVGINYLMYTQQRWGWHSTRMPGGAFDPIMFMTEGYQISTSNATKFTFIGV